MIARKIAVAVLCLASCISACNSAPTISTAGDLVAKLQQSGVAIESQEPAPKPTGNHFRFDEAIRIKGQELFVDVIRIEDRRVFDIAKSAGQLLFLAEAAAGQPIPDNPYVFSRHPFVVVIRQQPAALNLEQTLAKLLPPERE